MLVVNDAISFPQKRRSLFFAQNSSMYAGIIFLIISLKKLWQNHHQEVLARTEN